MLRRAPGNGRPIVLLDLHLRFSGKRLGIARSSVYRAFAP